MARSRPKDVTLDAVLDGRTRASELARRIADEGAAGTGLTAAEVELIQSAPSALRVVLYARRFGLQLPAGLRGASDVARWWWEQAAQSGDPFDVADLELLAESTPAPPAPKTVSHA